MGFGPSIVLAATEGHVDVVRYVVGFLESHRHLAVDEFSLLAAVHVGLIDEARHLNVKRAVDVNAPFDSTSVFPSDGYLAIACARADVAMVALLLHEGGADADYGGAAENLNAYSLTDRGTPLRLASDDRGGKTQQREEIVRLLIAHGADVDAVMSAVAAEDELARASRPSFLAIGTITAAQQALIARALTRVSSPPYAEF